MITKKNINKVFIIFILAHLFLWTLIPSISNLNLPLDTIEALAWGSNLDWGFSKHPPFSAFAVESFYKIFGNNDWAYYLLSQIFVIIAFYFVWKCSNQFFEDETYSLLSVFILSGIFFYNFTTPEFNVNISQLPFWASSVYFFWKGLHSNKKINWILFGIFSAIGFLSKYLFIYILLALLIFFLFNVKKYKQLIKNYSLSILLSLILLTPHFIWLFDNNFITIFYGLERSGVSAIIMEDKVGLKKNSLFKNQTGTKQDKPQLFAKKIKKICNSRQSQDFMVIARIESFIVGKGLKDALNRAEIYSKAGADAILIHSKEKTPTEIFSFAKEFKKSKYFIPLVSVPSTYSKVYEKDLIKNGFKLVIYANQLLRAAYPAMQNTARTILKNKRAFEADKKIIPIKEIINLIKND